MIASTAEAKAGLLGVGLELRAHLTLLELLGEPLVIAPKQANVCNVKQHHGQTLQTQPGSKYRMDSESVWLHNSSSSSSSSMLLKQIQCICELHAEKVTLNTLAASMMQDLFAD